MTTVTQPEPMTAEQLWALPDDGKDRWLINGQLRETEMTKRNRGHSRAEATICLALGQWLGSRPKPRGEVLVGEAGFRMNRNPETVVGIDVAYVSADVAAANADDERIVEGVPVLAVEILSPSDKHENVAEKVESYLECGVKLVWIVDPRFDTITVYRADAAPQLFNVTQEIDGGPHLPGFRVSVREIFAR